MTTIDVHIAVRNGEAYLRGALESVFAQTQQNYIVTVVNDGSTDRSVEIAESFGSKVRCVSTLPQGLSAARNIAIEQSNSEFIAFLDCDDLWYPEKLARQVAFLESHPECVMLHTQEDRIDESGRSILIPDDEREFKKVQGDAIIDLLKANTIILSSVMLRRSAIETLRFAQNLYGAQDYFMFLQLARHGSIGFVDDVLTQYRVHSGAMSQDDERITNDCLWIMEQVTKWDVSSELRELARQRWSNLQLGKARRAFRRSEYNASNRAYREVASLTWQDRFRYGATFLPAPLTELSRRFWSVISPIFREPRDVCEKTRQICTPGVGEV